MNIYILYKVTNLINEKSYIGFTGFSLEKRKKEHLKSVRLGSEFNFHRAIRKYGIENFKWEIIFESYDKNHTLNIMEPFFIAAYNTLSEGYNMTSGGDGARDTIISDEVRKNLSEKGKLLIGNKNPFFGKNHSKEKWAIIGAKISKANLGKKRTEEQKLNISRAMSGKKRNVKNRRPHTPETKLKISLSQKERIKNSKKENKICPRSC